MAVPNWTSPLATKFEPRADVFPILPFTRERRPRSSQTTAAGPQEAKMLNGWLALLIGVPSLIIVLLWLVGYLR